MQGSLREKKNKCRATEMSKHVWLCWGRWPWPWEQPDSTNSDKSSARRNAGGLRLKARNAALRQQWTHRMTPAFTSATGDRSLVPLWYLHSLHLSQRVQPATQQTVTHLHWMQPQRLFQCAQLFRLQWGSAHCLLRASWGGWWLFGRVCAVHTSALCL